MISNFHHMYLYVNSIKLPLIISKALLLALHQHYIIPYSNSQTCQRNSSFRYVHAIVQCIIFCNDMAKLLIANTKIKLCIPVSARY